MTILTTSTLARRLAPILNSMICAVGSVWSLNGAKSTSRRLPRWRCQARVTRASRRSSSTRRRWSEWAPRNEKTNSLLRNKNSWRKWAWLQVAHQALLRIRRRRVAGKINNFKGRLKVVASNNSNRSSISIHTCRIRATLRLRTLNNKLSLGPIITIIDVMRTIARRGSMSQLSSNTFSSRISTHRITMVALARRPITITLAPNYSMFRPCRTREWRHRTRLRC